MQSEIEKKLVKLREVHLTLSQQEALETQAPRQETKPDDTVKTKKT